MPSIDMPTPVQSPFLAPKTVKITYWSLTLFFTLFMAMDGVAGLLREETGQEVMRHLGYPIYLLSITGAAKLLGAVALLQTRYRTIKEWAYAGFTFNFIGAGASWLFTDGDVSAVMPPLIALAVMLLSYVAWKRYEALKSPY